MLTTVAMLKERGIALLSLEERIDTNSAAGELVFAFVAPWLIGLIKDATGGFSYGLLMLSHAI